MSALVNDLLNAWKSKGKDKRFILGIVGAPGAGKSTLAASLCDEVNKRNGDDSAIVVPMDGFHYSNEYLKKIDLLPLKGIPSTFDAHGFLDCLIKIKTWSEQSVYCPRFERSIEASIANDIEVKPHHKLIISEGNYLLLDESPWNQIADLLDQSWYIDCPGEVIFSRLIERHMDGGKSREDARAKVESTDLPNALLIEATIARATRVLNCSKND